MYSVVLSQQIAQLTDVPPLSCLTFGDRLKLYQAIQQAKSFADLSPTQQFLVQSAAAHRGVTIKNDHAALLGSSTKGGEGSGNFHHAGRPGEIGGSAPEHPGRVWQGKRHEGESTLTKLETGSIGEHAVIDVLSQIYGVEFGTVNVNVNNAPFDVAGDSLAVEVKTGLATNDKSAHRWRATIGQPGKAETELLKHMSDEEKRAHNERKMQAILDRKYGLLKKMSEQAGHPIKPMTVGLILRGDGKAADIYQFEGFHLKLNWSTSATDEHLLGTYDVENKVMHWHKPPSELVKFAKFFANYDTEKYPTTSDIQALALGAALAEVDQDFAQVYQWWLEHVDPASGTIKGGPGSGFHGHAGRPGERGGSARQGGTTAADAAPKWRTVDPDPKPKPKPILRPQPKPGTPTYATPKPVPPPPKKAGFVYLDEKRTPWLKEWEAKRKAYLEEAASLPVIKDLQEAYATNEKRLLTEPLSKRHEIRAKSEELATQIELAKEKERSLFLKHFGEPFGKVEDTDHIFGRVPQGVPVSKKVQARIAEAHDFLNRVFSNWPMTEAGDWQTSELIFSDTIKRASADGKAGVLYLNPETSGTDVIIHEFGHVFEDNSLTFDGARLGEAMRGFRAARTHNEHAFLLRDLKPGFHYGPDEIATPDHFLDPYVGRIYPNGETELLSTGLQYLYQSPAKFASEDPEHFLVTILAAKGKLR